MPLKVYQAYLCKKFVLPPKNLHFDQKIENFSKKVQIFQNSGTSSAKRQLSFKSFDAEKLVLLQNLTPFNRLPSS